MVLKSEIRSTFNSRTPTSFYSQAAKTLLSITSHSLNFCFRRYCQFQRCGHHILLHSITTYPSFYPQLSTSLPESFLFYFGVSVFGGDTSRMHPDFFVPAYLSYQIAMLGNVFSCGALLDSFLVLDDPASSSNPYAWEDFVIAKCDLMVVVMQGMSKLVLRLIPYFSKFPLVPSYMSHQMSYHFAVCRYPPNQAPMLRNTCP